MPLRARRFWGLTVVTWLATALPSFAAAPVLKWAYGGCASGPYCQTGWYSSPAVADLDGDGQPDVVWAAYDVVSLNGANGALKWRAPNGQRVWPGVVVADLTGDGTLEVVAGRGGDQLTVYDRFGGVVFARNPFGGGEVRTLAVADLDGNGSLEIVVGRASGGATRQLNVFEPDGSVRPGWPARHDGEAGYGWGMYNENVALADLDGDGFKEVLGPTDTHYITALDRNGNQIAASAIYGAGKVWSEVGVHVDHAVDLRGYANCGVEHRPNFADSAPAVADVNGDGTPEWIVVGNVYDCGTDPYTSLYRMPFLLRRDRTRWTGSGFDWTVLPLPGPGSAPLSEDYNVIDQGRSGATSEGRSGFARVMSEVALGRVGIVLAIEASRLARNNADWQRLIWFCSLTDTLTTTLGEGTLSIFQRDARTAAWVGLETLSLDADGNRVSAAITRTGDYALQDANLARPCPTGDPAFLPVLLVHGWQACGTGDISSFGLLPDLLCAEGVDVFAISYNTANGIETSGQTLRTALDTMVHDAARGGRPAAGVIVVGHSMRGLVARSAIQQSPPGEDKVFRLVTAGAPHLGAEQPSLLSCRDPILLCRSFRQTGSWPGPVPASTACGWSPPTSPPRLMARSASIGTATLARTTSSARATSGRPAPPRWRALCSLCEPVPRSLPTRTASGSAPRPPASIPRASGWICPTSSPSTRDASTWPSTASRSTRARWLARRRPPALPRPLGAFPVETFVGGAAPPEHRVVDAQTATARFPVASREGDLAQELDGREIVGRALEDRGQRGGGRRGIAPQAQPGRVDAGFEPPRIEPARPLLRAPVLLCVDGQVFRGGHPPEAPEKATRHHQAQARAGGPASAGRSRGRHRRALRAGPDQSKHHRGHQRGEGHLEGELKKRLRRQKRAEGTQQRARG